MGWDDIQESNGESADYVKIESGKMARVHLLDEEPFSFYQHRKQGEKKPVRCKVVNCAYCNNTEYDKKRRFAINVYNLEAKKVQILEQGPQVFGQIKTIWEAYEKNLSTIDLTISRKGDGLNTEYSVVPVPTKFKPEMMNGTQKYNVPKHYGVETTGEAVQSTVDEEPPF